MADGDAPAALWSHRLEPTSELALPSNPDLVLYGVVVAGAVAVGNDQVIGTWHAFRAPGVGVKLAPDGDRPADVVLAFVSDGQAVRDVAKRRAAPGRGPELLDVVDVNAKEDLVFAKGSSHVRIAFEDGPASLQIMLASKDAPVPRHEHAKSWEVIGLLQGNGSFSLGGKAREVTTQTILAIPPATDHAFAPAGDTGLLAVQLYVPPGPEQRFKELAAGD
jgi:mannose-6-phosphate isomerase-like protein (cupin superfamily)